LFTPKLAYPAFLEFNVAGNVNILQKIGEGGFGTLHEGEIRNSELVRKFKTTKCAVKFLKEPKIKDVTNQEAIARLVASQLEEFKHELSVMFSLQGCENIIKIIGCARVPQVAMVTKLYKMNLKEFLYGSTIDMKLIASLAHDMLNGIAAVHKREFGEMVSFKKLLAKLLFINFVLKWKQISPSRHQTTQHAYRRITRR
jgi:serine/threonine protein kinase